MSEKVKFECATIYLKNIGFKPSIIAAGSKFYTCLIVDYPLKCVKIPVSENVKLHKDKFSYASLHKYLTAHFEHTVVITEDGNEVLTMM